MASATHTLAATRVGIAWPRIPEDRSFTAMTTAIIRRVSLGVILLCAAVHAGRPDYDVAGTEKRVGTWWEYKWMEDCNAACGQSGTRTLKAMCMKDHMEQSDVSWCPTPAVTDTTEACTVECYWVDPLNGLDSNPGTSAAAFKSVGACTALASTPTDTVKHVTRHVNSPPCIYLHLASPSC